MIVLSWAIESHQAWKSAPKPNGTSCRSRRVAKVGGHLRQYYHRRNGTISRSDTPTESAKPSYLRRSEATARTECGQVDRAPPPYFRSPSERPIHLGRSGGHHRTLHWAQRSHGRCRISRQLRPKKILQSDFRPVSAYESLNALSTNVPLAEMDGLLLTSGADVPGISQAGSA
jgi:hypothetical protein